MSIIDRLFRKSDGIGRPVTANHLNFDELLKSSRYVVVDFWGKNCPPCDAVDPIVKKLSKEYCEKVLFLKVNVTSNPEIAGKFKIRSVPSFLFFESGRLKDRKVGAMNYDAFKRWIDGIISSPIR